MAAYLQSLIYGFGGVRIRPQMLEFFDPTPPPGCTLMRFKGFDYLQVLFQASKWCRYGEVDLMTRCVNVCLVLPCSTFVYGNVTETIAAGFSLTPILFLRSQIDVHFSLFMRL